MRLFKLACGIIPILLLCAVNAMPTTDHPSSALAVRVPGDLEATNGFGNNHAALFPRANTALLYTAFATTWAGATVAVCAHWGNNGACLAYVAVGTAYGLAVGALSLYNTVTVDMKQNALELKGKKKEYKKLKVELKTARITLKHAEAAAKAEEAKSKFTVWENKHKELMVQFSTSMQYQLLEAERYAKLAGDHFKAEVEAARTNFTSAMTAGEKIRDASPEDGHATRLQDWLRGIADDPDKYKGVPSQKDYDDLMQLAEKSIDTLVNKISDYVERAAKAQEEAKNTPEPQVDKEDSSHIPGSFPDDSGEGPSQRRVRRGGRQNLPRLIREVNEDCENRYCHRMWISHSQPTNRGKRDDSSGEVIHHIYSTPLDFDLNEHGSLSRRQGPDKDDDEDDDLPAEYECENEQSIVGDGDDEPFVVKVSLIFAGDFKSLKQMNQMKGKQVDEYQKQLDAHKKDIASGKWVCIKGDTPNGGVPAYRGALVASSKQEMYEQDVHPIIESCRTAKFSSDGS